MLVEKLYLQQSPVALPGTQVKFNLQLLGGRNLTFHTGIVEGIAVRECQPAVVEGHRGTFR